jgi:hypothetical protein
MNPKEIIEKLRLTFAELTGNPVEQPVALATATLIHGTEVEVTELAVGGIVTIGGSPAPVGEHELSDGTVIVLGENGVIMEIKPAAAVEVEVETKKDDMDAKFSAFEAATNQKFASYESKFAEYETKLAKANQVIEGLLNLTQTLAETPTGSADASIKTTNSFQDEPKAKSLDILFS